MIYTFNCNWVDTRWQQYSTHLHTNNTQNAENGTYITIKKLNIHNNIKLTNTVTNGDKSIYTNVLAANFVRSHIQGSSCPRRLLGLSTWGR
jgi:hypothetical protein